MYCLQSQKTAGELFHGLPVPLDEEKEMVPLIERNCHQNPVSSQAAVILVAISAHIETTPQKPSRTEVA